MNQWKYKIIGLVLGALTRRPQFMILGLIIGHLLDIGFFNKKSKDAESEQAASSKNYAGTANPYSILGVSETASMDEIEQAYRRKISDYHPDKVANAALEIKELAEIRAREINAAFEEIQKIRNSY